VASIELKGLTKRFGELIAVNELNLEIRDKEFVALLGPSGCGKTTTMNMIAGIEFPTEGQILFGGQDMRTIPANKRDVGFVFQNYAIFTHMTVRKNLEFGLRVRGVDRDEINRRVESMAELMRLEDRLDWRTSKLSVNELQKVAIGRSAVTEPEIFLLDEPLSNLDAAFRAFMRTELKHLQHQFQQTMVYVTHDQIEAMSLADRIAVMNLGLLQQYGTPNEVYNKPRNTFVANFMGSPSMNLLACRLTGGDGSHGLDFGAAGASAIDDSDLMRRCKSAKSPEVIFGMRPEDIDIQPREAGGPGLDMEVSFVEPIGPRTVVHLSAGEHEVKVAKDKQYPIELGAKVRAAFPKGRCHIFDAESGVAIGLE
jgi:multiple sugar transport system ATP-binding protein